ALGQTIDVINGCCHEVRAAACRPVIDSAWTSIGGQRDRTVWRQRAGVAGGPRGRARAINVEANAERCARRRGGGASIQNTRRKNSMRAVVKSGGAPGN